MRCCAQVNLLRTLSGNSVAVGDLPVSDSAPIATTIPELALQPPAIEGSELPSTPAETAEIPVLADTLQPPAAADLSDDYLPEPAADALDDVTAPADLTHWGPQAHAIDESDLLSTLGDTDILSTKASIASLAAVPTAVDHPEQLAPASAAAGFADADGQEPSQPADSFADMHAYTDQTPRSTGDSIPMLVRASDVLAPADSAPELMGVLASESDPVAPAVNEQTPAMPLDDPTMRADYSQARRVNNAVALCMAVLCRACYHLRLASLCTSWYPGKLQSDAEVAVATKARQACEAQRVLMFEYVFAGADYFRGR